MAQFDVYKNSNTQTNELFPYLLDITNDLLSSSRVRVVIPLCSDNASIKHLNPSFNIANQKLYMSTMDIAGIPLGSCGTVVENISEKRTEIIDGLDFLVNGF